MPIHTLIYFADRDCCSQYGTSKYRTPFHKWDLVVRLDIWHFMRRLAGGCTTESHPLYGMFMSKMSAAIFEWDKDDFDHLVSAKRAEMVSTGISSPSESAVRKALSKEELAKHCRRRTRGQEAVSKNIEELILAFSTATDTLGVPILSDEIREIWAEQKRHVECIQDPPGVQLYTITHTITKGGVSLPVLRCARGSTSLESFHLHLARFVPGSSTAAVNFQAYLLDGLTT